MTLIRNHISQISDASMAQDIPQYDRPDFFNTYLTLPRQQKGHDSAPEWPTLRGMIGTVTDQQVLDLGCGLGWFARYAVESGAAHVDASDISNKMIEKAEELSAKELVSKIKYEVMDLNEAELKIGAYDLVYSSLTFHYLSNESFARLLKQIHRSLKPGGRLVFSVEHPIYTAPSNPCLETLADGREVWALDNYAEEGLRETNWLGGARKYHRTMTTYLKSLLDAGFVIQDFVEWMAIMEDVEKNLQWMVERHRPMFLIVKVDKL
jgi:SAM-dependent methyltransferase